MYDKDELNECKDMLAECRDLIKQLRSIVDDSNVHDIYKTRIESNILNGYTEIFIRI